MDDIKLFPLEKYKYLMQNHFFTKLSLIYDSKFNKESLILEEIEKERDKEYSLSLYDLGISVVNFASISSYL